jgi:hypothetical protein
MKIPTLFTVFFALGLALEGFLSIIPQIPILSIFYNWAIGCVVASIFYEYLPRKTFFALMALLSTSFLLTVLEYIAGGVFSLSAWFIILLPFVYITDILGTIAANKLLHHYKVFKRIGYKTTVKGFDRLIATVCLASIICISIGTAQLWYGVSNFHKELGVYGVWEHQQLGYNQFMIAGIWSEGYERLESAALQGNGILLGVGIGIVLTMIILTLKNRIKSD